MRKLLFCGLWLSHCALAQTPVALLPMNNHAALTPEKALQAKPAPPAPKAQNPVPALHDPVPALKLTPVTPPAENKSTATPPPVGDWSGYAQVESTAENGNPQEALRQLNGRLALVPDDSRAAYLKGLVLMQLGQSRAAERWLKMMQANFPDLPQVDNALAVLYGARGDLLAAEGVLRDLLQSHPKHHSAHANLAKIYLQLAQQELEKALKITPDDAMIARQLKALKSL